MSRLSLALAVSLSILPAALSRAADPLRILTLGDSITQGRVGNPGETTRLSYRYELWKMLIDANIDFDFVGSINVMENETTPYSIPDYMGNSFDRDHEGHWAWGTAQILSGYDGTGDSAPGNLSTWLAGYTPDIALIHLGTNDMWWRNQTPSQAAANLELIIDALQADNPNVKILLAELIPVSSAYGNVNSNILALNQLIPDIATDKTTATSKVLVVDQYTGFDTSTDTIDGIHPNSLGEFKIAQKWFDAIVPEPCTLAVLAVGSVFLATQRHGKRRL